MKVNFIISKEYDAKMLYNVFHRVDPLGSKQRAKENNIPIQILESIQKMDTFILTKGTLLFNFVNDYYSRFGERLKESKKSYKKEWSKIEVKFVDTIERITNTKFKYNEYYVLLSAFLIGISNDGDHNLVLVTGLADNPKEILFLIAYEILMSHLKNILYSTFPKEVEDSEQHLWAIAESTATFLLSIDMAGNWHGDVNDVDKAIENFNYKKIKKFAKELKPIYEKRENFHSYLLMANKFLKKNYNDYSFLD